MFTQPPARKITSDCHALILENCITDSGYYREPAATIVELMNSYTEYTPDLNGLQILFRVENISLDSTRYYLTNYDAGIEIKLAESMSSLLLTGNNVNDLPICDRTKEFQELLARFMQRPNEENNFETCGVNGVNGVKPQKPVVLEDSPFQSFVPLQIESSQLPPFPLEALPAAVQDYVEAIAVHSQTSIDMAATISRRSGDCPTAEIRGHGQAGIHRADESLSRHRCCPRRAKICRHAGYYLCDFPL